MTDHIIRDVANPEALYGEVSLGASLKEMTWLHPHDAALIKTSPFAVLATSEARIDGEAYDRELPECLKTTLY